MDESRNKMYDLLILLGLSLWLGLPAWIANAAPVFLGGGRPIDGGRVFSDGNRLFGDGKTIRGFIAGIICGTLTGVLQSLFASLLSQTLANYVIVTPEMEHVINMNITAAFLLSIGTMIGDLLGSFLKRRTGIESGGPSPVMDQLGFVIMALIVAFPIMQPDPQYVAVLVIVTLCIHWLSSALGYLMGFKSHPW